MDSKIPAYDIFNKRQPLWLDDYVSAQKVADILMIPRTYVKEFIYFSHVPFKYFRHILYIKKSVLKELLYITESYRYKKFLERDDVPIFGEAWALHNEACEIYDIPYNKWLHEWGFNYNGINRIITPYQKSRGKVLRDLTNI
ncbi:MAG TPA: hypothetical protein VFC79_06945 [Tissierellaceae bacterium]|nr:hypothetical protein [Tissierellaceae bacterium]